MAIFSQIPALVQMAMSYSQMRMAKDFEKQAGARPIYERPDEVMDALNMARTRAARSEMPGLGEAREMQREAGASAMNTARQASRTPAEMMGMAANVSANQMRGANQIGMQNAAYIDSAERDYMNQTRAMGEYADKEFEMNKFLPYMQNMAAASALRGAGMQNFMGGTNDFFGGLDRQTQAIGSLLTGKPGMMSSGQSGSQSSGFSVPSSNFQTQQLPADNGVYLNPNTVLPGGFNYRTPRLDFNRAAYTGFN
jgi:hypothetical protein